MSIFQRVAQYLANEIITKSLANSAWFQRFAARTHQHVNKVTTEGAKTIENIDTKKVASTAGYTIGRVAAIATSFPTAFARNLKREAEKAAQNLKSQ